MARFYAFGDRSPNGPLYEVEVNNGSMRVCGGSGNPRRRGKGTPCRIGMSSETLISPCC